MQVSAGRVAAGLCLVACALPAAASANASDTWRPLAGTKPADMRPGKIDVKPERFRAFTLNDAALRSKLAVAPKQRSATSEAPSEAGTVLELPAPDGSVQRFRVYQSQIMEPKLAALHPEIKTYAGVGIDDRTARIVADTTPLGFHASVRSAKGAWYIDPYYTRDDSVHVSYFRKDLKENPHGDFVERGVDGEDESDPLGLKLPSSATAMGPEVTLRTYRLALVTNPGYANYFGAENVTAAKVTLINRVNQIYEDETAIRLVLIGDTDKLNLNTAAEATGANGPCGNAACYTNAQVSSCSSGGLSRTRIVIGQLVGASNYDVGHLALGNPGGGVASLGVVGGNNKAQGCTGLAAPVGDYFAVDYVAHELGHQFNANHTFNGTQSNCSGGNRSAANSVEPGSGSTIMAYAGICQRDNLQPHTDPYWSFRSYDEIQSLVTGTRNPINEVQNISLRGFGTGDSLRLSYNGTQTAPITSGGNYTAAGIQQALLAILPEGANVTISGFGGSGNPSADGFQVTFTGSLAQTDQPLLGIEVEGGEGFVGETARGGPINNQGFIVTQTGNHAPDVTVPAANYVIPPRTPFALTGSATDPDGDTVTYLWQQTDRGGISGGSTAGTALTAATKTNGPLFRVFGKAADVTPEATQQYYSEGENAVGTDPTRVFPDIDQILAGQTNAETGTCPNPGTGTSPLPFEIRECFSEFLPTSDYVGFMSDRTLHFRLVARDMRPGGGGIGWADTSLTVAPLAGPFRVTSHATPQETWGLTPQLVTWDVAGTDVTPINVTRVKISLSVDGGQTYPYVLAAETENDGAETVPLPDVSTERARIKVEAVGNVFFDISDADLTIREAPKAEVSVGADVPATLALTLGAPVSFGAFVPGVQADYDASTSANVLSTAGDATLSVADTSATAPGHLVNGAFTLPQPLLVAAGGDYAPVSGTPVTLKTYDNPISNDPVSIAFRQRVGANDPLRTGTYAKTLTFTLSTTNP
jgi:hypothetical protein